MQYPMTFRVVSPFVAFPVTNNTTRFVTVPVGSVIETQQTIHSPGLAEIRLNDQPLLAFMRDLEGRTERLPPARVIEMRQRG